MMKKNLLNLYSKILRYLRDGTECSGMVLELLVSVGEILTHVAEDIEDM